VPFGTQAPLLVDHAGGGWEQGGWVAAGYPCPAVTPCMASRIDLNKARASEARQAEGYPLWVRVVGAVGLVGSRRLSTNPQQPPLIHRAEQAHR